MNRATLALVAGMKDHANDALARCRIDRRGGIARPISFDNDRKLLRKPGPRAIVRPVIDDDDLFEDAGQRRRHDADDLSDAVDLVIDRHQDRDIGGRDRVYWTIHVRCCE